MLVVQRVKIFGAKIDMPSYVTFSRFFVELLTICSILAFLQIPNIPKTCPINLGYSLLGKSPSSLQTFQHKLLYHTNVYGTHLAKGRKLVK